jgi:hypothetical protein
MSPIIAYALAPTLYLKVNAEAEEETVAPLTNNKQNLHQSNQFYYYY